MANKLYKTVQRALTLVLSLSCLLASAQYTSVFFNNVSLNQGLSQSCVVDITFDAKGFVWLATQDGLNRYDGKDFFVADKKFDDITSGVSSRLGKIVTGGDHFLWIIAKGGRLEKFNLVNNTFKPIDIASGNIKQVVTCLLADDNEKLWIGTSTGKLMIYDGRANRLIREISLPPPAPRQAINAVFKDRQQRIWVLGSTLGYLENNTIKPVEVRAAGLQLNIPYTCLSEDKEGNLWLGSCGNGLFVKKKTDPFFQRFKGFKTQSLPPDLVIEAILADRGGKIWVGTYGKGLFMINYREKKLEQLVNDKRNPLSIPFNDVLSIKQDANDGIWIGTDGGGVSYFNEKKANFILLNNQTVPQDVDIALIRSIATDQDNHIWVGTTNRGLTEINYPKGEYKTWNFPAYTKNTYNPNRIVALFTDPQNTLWIGTQGNGLILFDPRKGKITSWFHPESPKLKIPDATVWCMYPAGEGKVWAGTAGKGLCLMDKQQGALGNYMPQSATSPLTDAVRAIAPINDSILVIGFEKTGIQWFNTRGKTFKQPQSKELQAFFKTETNVKCLYYQKPVLWIGTGGRGLLTYNFLNGKTRLFTDSEGLPNNTIYGILPDNEGSLWVSTNKGLSRFNPAIVDNQPSLAQFTNYTAAQGLQSNEFNTGAYHKAANGTLLFGGINGLNIFNPSIFQDENQTIPVAFTRIMVDNEPIRSDVAVPFQQSVNLSYQNHSIAFNFAALDFFSSPQFHYYYKLDGYDKKWIDANQRNYVSYTNVPAGRYNFLVKYTKPGASGGSAARMGINITGPLWKNAWFVITAVLLFLAIIYGVYRYRIAQVLKLVQIRQRIASDLHDDIGSTLSNINILSELSKKSLGEPSQAHLFLNRISEEVQTTSQSLDDIIWSVNIRNDTWEETFSRMRRYAAEVFENSATLYTIKLEEQPGMTRLNMEKRKDIFLIYKEIINNIHKHAEATEVEISMWFKEKQLMMAISDNGKGFDKNAQTHRNGLKNLSTRVARWKGNLQIDTSPNGTTIRITL